MAIKDRNGFLVAVGIERASPAEVTLLEDRPMEGKPKGFLGDKDYGSDALDARLAQQRIEMVAPNKCNRMIRTQDGRRLRHCKCC